MRTMIRRLAAVTVATAAATLTAIGTADAGSTGTTGTTENYNCPSGYACIYPEGQAPPVSPSHKYARYGAHNLVNQFNMHYVINNQYGGPRATVRLCTGYNGTGDCSISIPPQVGIGVDLTPINSIVLDRP
ncbi:hypothetical protein [Streptomyces sp. URMC 124]|uniref:hypothetical protein n=1 Tax=Streptomyces sp. URMC 124 TaxID=3423405 RepID=UPI003F1DBEDB